MKIKDERIGVYVGLNDTGEVVQYFDAIDVETNHHLFMFENRIDSVVSIGYVEAVPVDYDEVYTVEKPFKDQHSGAV